MALMNVQSLGQYTNQNGKQSFLRCHSVCYLGQMCWRLYICQMVLMFCPWCVFVMQIIARVSLDNRTRALVKGLQRVTDVKLLTSRVEELIHHLLEFPETRGVAVKVSLYRCWNCFYTYPAVQSNVRCVAQSSNVFVSGTF